MTRPDSAAAGCSGCPWIALGQIAQADALAAAKDHGVLDRGAQFADVARPVVALKRLLRVGGKAGDLLLVLLGEFLDERR